MARTLFVCALLAAVPSAALAQKPPAPTETVVRMTVQPAAAPQPALKYRLLPQLKDMEPGNPILGYQKCFNEQQNFWYRKDAIANRVKWQDMPLHDLPLQEVRNYGYTMKGPLGRADHAARLANPDWQILLQLKREGPTLLLPDVQQLRELADALRVRFRAQLAEHNYDDALVTAQTLFALSRHMGQHPTLIVNLVGTAVANRDALTLEEMIQQPDCPNLYWALADLPHPLLSLRAGLGGEGVMADWIFAGLNGREAVTEAQLRQVVDRIDELAKTEKPRPLDAPAWLEAHARDKDYVAAACRRLTESGLAAERLKELPALQVVFLDQRREYEARRDEMLKWMTLPYWQGEAGLQAAMSDNARATTPAGKLAALQQLPAVTRKASARVQQRLDLLQHVEALRLYAAEHDGKLPAHLSDIALPLPVDPFTGKAFVYESDGQTAVVRGTPPKGEEKSAPYNVRYEVTIKK
jgi:hypothetical protein